jgi:ferredoxin
MADRDNKHPLDLPGRYFNDDSCIDCGLCPEIAPHIFRRDDASGMSYVWHQPVTAEDIALAEEALERCPTESIGNDGDDAS